MIRVLLVDDQPILRLSMHLLLDRQPDIEVVGEAQDGIEAIQAVRDLDPDVVVMDLKMPRVGGVDATRKITHVSPRTRVIGFSMMDDPETEPEIRSVGAFALVHKHDGLTALLEAIRSASEAQTH